MHTHTRSFDNSVQAFSVHCTKSMYHRRSESKSTVFENSESIGNEVNRVKLNFGFVYFLLFVCSLRAFRTSLKITKYLFPESVNFTTSWSMLSALAFS